MTRDEIIEKMARAIETHDTEYFSEWERLRRYSEMSIAALDVVTKWLEAEASAVDGNAAEFADKHPAIAARLSGSSALIRCLIAKLKGETK